MNIHGGKMEFETPKKPKSIFSRFYSRRWEMVFMIFSGIAIVYTLRVNVSVAAQKMRDELNWTEAQKGLVLSAFYWGYSLGQIPASYFIQRYGAKWIFGLSVAIPSCLTLLVPVASRHSFGLALFIRGIIGFFESASFPAVYHFFPIWVPIKEKTMMIPAIASGMYMGEIIGFSVSGVLVAAEIQVAGSDIGGWPSVFYLFGSLGILWFPYWAMMAYESPAVHPHMTLEELEFINEGKAHMSHHHQPPVKHISPVTKGTAASGASTGNPHLASPASEFSYDGRSPMVHDTANPMTMHSNVKNNNSSDNAPLQTHAQFQRSISIGHDGMVPVFLNEELEFEARHGGDPRYGALPTTVALIDGGDDDDDAILDDHNEMAKRTPWLAFFTHPVALTLFINSWANGWIGFTLLSEMPSYLTDVLGFDLTSAGILCVFPYMTLFFSNLGFGALFQYLQSKHGWSTDKVRQIAEFTCLFGSAFGLVICSFMPDKYVAYTFMILTQLLFGAGQSGLGCAYSDVAPNYSSSLNSIGNTIGAVAGIVGPIVVAAFIGDYPGAWGWRGAFFLTAGMAIVALITWAIYQTSVPVPALNMPAKRHDRHPLLR